MTLRSRLTLAFFAISVVPLAAVTLFSYVSSERALRRAAAQQADELAVELGRRMEVVTADIERRIERAWPPPASAAAAPDPADRRASRGGPVAAPAPPQQVSPEQMAGHVAGVLGDMAPILDAVEFVAPPGAPRGAPPPPPDVPTPPRPPGGRGPGDRRGGSDVMVPVITPRAAAEMSQAMRGVMQRYQAGQTAEGQAQLAEWTARLQEQIRQGLAQYSRSQGTGIPVMRAAGPRSSGTAGPATADGRNSTTVLRGNALHTEVRQDGQRVGEINARINPERLFRAVLTMSRRDRNEIPFAVDADGRLHAPRSSDRGTIESLKLTSNLPTSGTNVRSINDWVVATRKDPSGATIGIARPLGDELRDLRRVALGNFAVGFGLIALVFVASIPLAGGMTKNLRRLMDGVKRLSAGDLAARVELKSHDEFGRLGTAFNQMAENLAAHEQLVVQQERIKRELELCRLIQNEMLPHQPLRLGLAEVKGVSIPAREVGGDFFNYFVLPDGEIALLVGDVSGKGVGAALLMANVQATLRARLPLEQNLARLADALDRDLEQNTPLEVYLTLFVGIVDTARGELRYVNAGHNPQFVLRADGGFERMASTGRPLGLLAGAGYEEVKLALNEGDILFFYTDGMVDAENERGEFIGGERLEAALASSPRGDVDSVLVHVEGIVRTFRGETELSDDATMMALRFGGNQLSAGLV
jgi:serine phosphatase RsbU (regulator of sigma subunit)